MGVVCVIYCLPQASKLQSLYSQTESQVAESEAKVAELNAQLVAAQDQAEILRRELRNMQVGMEQQDTEQQHMLLLRC